MNEATKARQRLSREGAFAKYINGLILDIGCGPDPVHPTALGWDLPQGDAQLLDGVPSNHFDTVFSSHCLEHMVDAKASLQRWWEVLKPGGYMVVIVPDEDLYEQGRWPSIFNADHKHTFTLHKSDSWSPASINLLDLVATLPSHQLISARTIDTNYNHSCPHPIDQSLGDVEVALEVVVWKVPPTDV